MWAVSLLISCSFLVKFQIEGLQERLKNKDGTIERKSKESQAASSDKRRLESEVAELKDQLDTKERKISVLQRKVCPFATQRKSIIATEKSPSLLPRTVCHCYREKSIIATGKGVSLLQRKSDTVLHRKGLSLI